MTLGEVLQIPTGTSAPSVNQQQNRRANPSTGGPASQFLQQALNPNAGGQGMPAANAGGARGAMPH